MSKKQWKNVTDNLSLQFSSKSSSSWSQDEPDAPTMKVSEIRSVLPTKTSATRQISDLENISENGPFLLNFSNIPFEADENAIKNFFQAYEIINVTKNELKRGTGIIEFKEFNGLAGALSMSEKPFINRPIRLTIGNKDDLVRIQSGAGQRNRFQNQPRNLTSTLSEDSDNWRTKKSQPVSQAPTENFASKNERSSWREKPVITTRNTDDKVSSDNTNNWRRQPTRDAKSGNFNKRNQSVQDNAKPSAVVDRSEPRESDLVKETKKASIFGEAKPVDTLSKDLEIEQKIELKKQIGDEPTKTEVSPATNPWVSKKQANAPPSSAVAPVVEKSDKLEWRGTKKVPVNSKMSNTQRELPVQAEPPKIAEPQPAPIPVNVWTERMKSKAVTVPVSVDRNNSAIKPSLDKSSTKQSISNESTVPTSTVHNVGGDNSVQSLPLTELKSIQKPPVVISANGPFIDPKSRTPHHSMSDSSSKAPIAVPINKSSSSDSNKDSNSRFVSKPFSSCPEQQPKPTAPINTCSTQNPWAKGPPKGLIEKTEVNH